MAVSVSGQCLPFSFYGPNNALNFTIIVDSMND